MLLLLLLRRHVGMSSRMMQLRRLLLLLLLLQLLLLWLLQLLSGLQLRLETADIRLQLLLSAAGREQIRLRFALSIDRRRQLLLQQDGCILRHLARVGCRCELLGQSLELADEGLQLLRRGRLRRGLRDGRL